MGWTITASIAAAIGAIGSAIAAIIMCSQNATKLALTIRNNPLTEIPQNVYNNEDIPFAFVHAEIRNKSQHPITISHCYIQIGKKEFPSLYDGIAFDFKKSITVMSSKHSKKDLKYEDYTKFPLVLEPFHAIQAYLLFPDFKESNASIIKGKIKFDYGRRLHKSKKIIIHKLSSAKKNQNQSQQEHQTE